MTTSNYKTTVGGAFSALGTTLMGVGIVPQLAGNSSKVLTVLATIGFCCLAIGQFLGHLFAADAKTVSDLKDEVALQSTAIRTGDTSMLVNPNPTKDTV